MATQTRQTLSTLDANLLHDIGDFTPVFHRHPTPHRRACTLVHLAVREAFSLDKVTPK